jgi:hypothetical protein
VLMKDKRYTSNKALQSSLKAPEIHVKSLPFDMYVGWDLG